MCRLSRLSAICEYLAMCNGHGYQTGHLFQVKTLVHSRIYNIYIYTGWWLSPTLMVNILLIMVNIWLMMVNNIFWLVVFRPTPLKNDGVSSSVGNDYSIPN